MGANWKVDKSNLIVEKCMEAGIAPYGNAKARAKSLAMGRSYSKT